MEENSDEQGLPTSTVKNLVDGDRMAGRVQQLAETLQMTSDDFIGEMRKRGCSEPTALKIWQGLYEEFKDFSDNDIYLSNLRKAADVLKVPTGALLPR